MKTLCITLLLIGCLCCVEGFKKGEKGRTKKQLEERHQPIKRTEDVQVEVNYRPDTCEKKSRSGDTLSMHYTGTFKDSGKMFDSSVARGEPFSFRLGAGQVIQGWERGLQGMCVGEKRRLTIPPHYAYGEVGHPPTIPPLSTLVFEVELLGIA